MMSQNRNEKQQIKFDGNSYKLSQNNDKSAVMVNRSPYFSEHTAAETISSRKITLPFRGESHRWVKIIDNFLSDDQCNDLLAFSEYFPWGIFASRYGKITKNRVVLRQLIDCPPLAAKINELIKPHLPEKFGHCHYARTNFRFRFLKYFPKMFHNPHRDRFFNDGQGNQTIFTVMIYLMDDCEGGETVLLDPNEVKDPIKVSPTKGRALIFEHGVFHSGNHLISGEKRALRLDVLYTILDPRQNLQSYLGSRNFPNHQKKQQAVRRNYETNTTDDKFSTTHHFSGKTNIKTDGRRKKKKNRKSDFERFQENFI